MIKTFKIEHSWSGNITVEVDEEKVEAYEWQGKKRNLWHEINTFWSGHENRFDRAGGDDRKAALLLLCETALYEARHHNLFGIVEAFKHLEGWPPLDGSFGIKIVDFNPFEFDEDDFDMEELDMSGVADAK